MLRAPMQRRFYVLRKRFRLRDSRRVHACPIHAGQKRGQLRGIHPHDAGRDGRPFEAAAIEPLQYITRPLPSPDDNLYPIRALCTEDHRHTLIGSWPSVSFAKSAKPSAPFLKSTGWVAT